MRQRLQTLLRSRDPAGAAAPLVAAEGEQDPLDPARGHARLLLSESREELARADSKASMLLAAVGVGVSVVVGGALSGGWSPTDLDRWPEVAWWCGVGLAALGIVLLASSVYPRVSHKGDRHELAYFGHVKQFQDRSELREALLNVSPDPFDRLVDQVSAISVIIWSKYRAIRWALWLLAIAAVVCIAAPVANRWL